VLSRAVLVAQNVTIADGQETCKSGRMRVGWRRRMEEEAATVGKTWREIKTIA